MMYIYKTTNLINGKTYVGQYTDFSDSFVTYLGSGKLIRAAIKKYGKENFKKEVIIQGNFNKNLLDELEKHYIQLYSSPETPMSYNLDKGGNSSNKSCKKVYKYTLDGVLVSEYQSPFDAAKSVNTTASAIRSSIQKGITSKGFLWTYSHNDITKKVMKLKNSLNLMSSSRAKEPIYVYYDSKWTTYTSCGRASKALNISKSSVSNIINSKVKCGWIKNYFISNQLFIDLPQKTFNTTKYKAINKTTNQVYDTVLLFSANVNIPLSTAAKYLRQGNDVKINDFNICFVEH